MANFGLKRNIFGLLAVLVVVAVAAVPLISFASTPAMNQYLLPANTLGGTAPASTGPNSIVAGPDGDIWFAEQYANRVGKINPTTHAITEYNLTQPTPGATTLPDSIIEGPDGNMWFSQANGFNGYGAIGKISPTGTITEYPITVSSVASPHSLVFGPDGNIWFTTYGSNIGVMDTNGNIVHHYMTGPDQWSSVSRAICVGPDNQVWFINSSSTVAKINPTNGVETTYNVPQIPFSLVSGPGGDVWFASSASYIGKIDPTSSAVVTYNIPAPPKTASVSQYVGPQVLDVGPDGNIWYALPSYGVGEYNISNGTFSEYEAHDYGNGPSGDTVGNGPDGNLWFTSFTQQPAVGDIVLNTGGGSTGTAPTFTSPSSVAIASGSNLDFTITTSGNPTATISELSSLLPGISFRYNGNGTATLSGTVTTKTTEKVTLNLTATNSVSSASQTLTLTIVANNDCTTTPSSTNSSSGCSANVPGQANDANAYPVTVSGNATTVVIQKEANGNTVAVVIPGLNLSDDNYTVPAKQTLYDDGTLGSVTAEANGIVKGSGKVANNIVIDKGATLAPGHSPGCLSAGGLMLYGTYEAQIGGSSACSGYDQVAISGKSIITGDLLVSSAGGFVPSLGESFTILQSAANELTGQFQGYREGSLVSAQGVNYRISYKDESVILTAISVDNDIASTATAPIDAKLVSAVIPKYITTAGVLFVTLAVLSAVSVGVLAIRGRRS